MLTSLRNHFGIPGIIAVCALVFAMLGGAYAASNSGGDQEATASATGKQGPRGKPGPRGKTGKTGPAGPQGPAGAKGDTGAPGAAGLPGAKGTNGTNGTNGKSVFVDPLEAGVDEECEELGGAILEEEDGDPSVEVCNGEQGEVGEKGEPWTPNGTLPVNATETGAWAFNSVEGASEAYVPISFPIKLAAALGEDKVHFPTDLDFATKCTGGINNPTAPSGHLCVYGNVEFGALENATFTVITSLANSGVSGTSKTGALIVFDITGEPAFGYGAWAVTG